MGLFPQVQQPIIYPRQARRGRARTLSLVSHNAQRGVTLEVGLRGLTPHQEMNILVSIWLQPSHIQKATGPIPRPFGGSHGLVLG